MVDEGHDVNMKMMQTLYKRVWEDIIEEEWHEILTSGYKLNTSNIPGLIARRCVPVLKRKISDQLLGDESI